MLTPDFAILAVQALIYVTGSFALAVAVVLGVVRLGAALATPRESARSRRRRERRRARYARH